MAEQLVINRYREQEEDNSLNWPRIIGIAFVIALHAAALLALLIPAVLLATVATGACMVLRRAEWEAQGGFDEGMMCHGIELVKKKLQEIKEDEDSSAKDDDLFTTLEVCYEFYLRGFTFAPIDIYHSHATKFQIEAGQLRPPFVAVAGLGETAAWDLMNAREGREFLSVEEFADACPKVSKTLIDQLQSAGAFGDLPLTSQLTLF